MKKVLGLVLVIAFLTAPQIKAENYVFFNGATADGIMSIPGPSGTGVLPYLETQGAFLCKCRVKSATTSQAVVTLQGTDNFSGTWETLYTFTDPASSDPNNYIFGVCPRYVRGVISGYQNGVITMTFETTK